MSDKNEKYSFIVVKYPQKETGEAALAAVQALAKEKIVKLKDAVAITKTEKGKIKIHQTKDDTAGKGFLTRIKMRRGKYVVTSGYGRGFV